MAKQGLVFFAVLALSLFLLVPALGVTVSGGSALLPLTVEPQIPEGTVPEIGKSIEVQVSLDSMLGKNFPNKYLDFKVTGVDVEDENLWSNNNRQMVSTGWTEVSFNFKPNEAKTYTIMVQARLNEEPYTLVAQGTGSVSVTSVKNAPVMCANISVHQDRATYLEGMASAIQAKKPAEYTNATSLIGDAKTLLANAKTDCDTGFYEEAQTKIIQATSNLDAAERAINTANSILPAIDLGDYKTIALIILMAVGLVFAIKLFVFAGNEGKEHKPM